MWSLISLSCTCNIVLFKLSSFLIIYNSFSNFEAETGTNDVSSIHLPIIIPVLSRSLTFSEGEQEEAWLTEAGLAQLFDDSLAADQDQVSIIYPLLN